MKLFLKGPKCFSEKCPVEKRNFAPGQHGKDRKAGSAAERAGPRGPEEGEPEKRESGE